MHALQILAHVQVVISTSTEFNHAEWQED